MKPTSVKAKPGEFTGRHMLFVMIAFFGVIVAVNITMAVLAGQTWTGLVVKNSYVASQHFNEDLAVAKAIKARGWKSSLRYADGTLSFTLKDPDGAPVVVNNLAVNYGRPAFEQADQTARLQYESGGVYRTDVRLAPGVWALRISGGRGDKSYRRDSRITVREDGRNGTEQ